VEETYQMINHLPNTALINVGGKHWDKKKLVSMTENTKLLLTINVVNVVGGFVPVVAILTRRWRLKIKN